LIATFPLTSAKSASHRQLAPADLPNRHATLYAEIPFRAELSGAEAAQQYERNRKKTSEGQKSLFAGEFERELCTLINIVEPSRS
jgi:hypothetical protein